MDSKIECNKFRIVMLPWLAYSHISRFLTFAKRLTNHNFHIYICSSQINMQYIKKNLSEHHKYAESIELVELNLPFSSTLPLQYHTTHGLPPNLFKTLADDYQKSGPDFATLLQKLNPHLVIYDFNQLWAPEVASSFNIPSIQLLSGCVALYSLHAHVYTKSLDEAFPFPEIYPKNHQNVIPKRGSAFNTRFVNCMKRSCEIILVRSTMELEGKYIDYLSQTLGKKVLPVGPLVQKSSQQDVDDHVGIMSWLDKKEASSVVFVCFGSEYFLPDNEIEDIAYGLELSQVNFIWAIRYPEGTKTSTNTLEQVLPNGFLEKIGDKGVVTDKWVPQAKILSHSSIGGFISHCGWSSTMESLHYGVPIIAMPVQFDQPYNARLMETVGVGIVVGRDVEGRLNREEMAEVVRKVVVEDSGLSIREKAKELGAIMKGKMEAEVEDMVIHNLVKLCEMNNN